MGTPGSDRLVLDLDDAAATAAPRTGGKAAALATARQRGLPTLPGVVLTTGLCRLVDTGEPLAAQPSVLEAFRRAGGAENLLVARSSSVVEDAADSSMAGRFRSVIGIEGFDEFLAAVDAVLASRRDADAADLPIAVLVQPLLQPALGGVLFGIDPVTGRSDRRVVSAVAGSPEPLVSGITSGSRYTLDGSGRAVEHDTGDGPALGRELLRRLTRLGDDVQRVFGGPQDVEWALDDTGTLWLLQSRPVTTAIRGVPTGPIFGPGPVAETFPEPLTELERDLWVPPLREAVRHAVVLAGQVSAKQARVSPVIVSVAGHVAIDLELAGELRRPRRLRQRLSPAPGLRRLRSAWRVGRLRAAVPFLAEHLLAQVDRDLEVVPPVNELTSRQLIALMHRSAAVLRALHAHEILMGMLTDRGQARLTGASVALRVLAEARRDGVEDADILRRSPVVLALSPPSVGRRPRLPPEVTALDLPTSGSRADADSNGTTREALRLRVRWVQELSARAAWELGERLAAAGDLPHPELIRHMDLQHLEAVATKRAVVVRTLVEHHRHDFGEPLPSWFQVSDRGLPIRAQCADEIGGGTGAGGGSGTGVVTFDAVDPPVGSVLVTTNLTPGLAPLLPRLHGIVAETGSVLSHLAILAREAGVATVVGYVGATASLPPGAVVVVDGDAGRVTVAEDAR